MSDKIPDEVIQEILALDEKRTPGEWIAGVHPGNHRINIIKPICFGKYVGKLPDCEGGHVYFMHKETAQFIAKAPTMAAIIRKQQKRIKELEEFAALIWNDGGNP